MVIFLETAELRAEAADPHPHGLLAGERGRSLPPTASPCSVAPPKKSRPHEQKVGALFLDYDQRRKALEAQAADAQDEAELKALENSIKHRTADKSS